MSPAPLKPFCSTLENEDTYRAFNLRSGFLAAVEEVVPEITGKLVEQVGPAYCKAVGLLDADRLREAAAQQQPEAEEVLAALKAWATPYHLHRDTWIQEYALRWLEREQRRLQTGDERLPLRGALTGVAFYLPVAASSDVLRPPEYQPYRETPVDYIERVRAYMAKVEAAYQASGWEEPPHKPNRLTHLLWLARHQCLRLPYDKCDTGANPSNVRKAIKELCRLLPLSLRPAPGRSGK